MSKEIVHDHSYDFKTVEVLDKGFVRLVDSMGDDDAVVQKARVSYGDGTKTISDDRTLIRYLIRNKHTSPLEGVVFKFHVKAPIFIFRQWHRHRTWSYNEISGRYSVLPEECYVPDEENVTTQDPSNKQGGTDIKIKCPQPDPSFISENESTWSEHFGIEQQNDRYHYKTRLDLGMRRELARINLPVSQYSEMYATVDLHNLFQDSHLCHILEL